MSYSGHGRDRIYLDAMASGPLHPEVAARMALMAQEGLVGNPSSIHWHGRACQALIDEAAEQVAAMVRGAQADQVVFTSGGTEANNMALKGVGLAHLGTAARIVISAIEHPSVRQTALYLRGLGLDVVEAPADRLGRVDVQALEDALTPRTAMVSVMWVNNETGVVQPVEEVAALCKARGVLFHTDATQAAGRLPLTMDLADMLTLSAHKFNGPQGVGALLTNGKARLTPLLHGGGQQMDRRAGTVPSVLCAGMGEAARLAERERETNMARLTGLGGRFLQLARDGMDDIRLNGSRDYCLPGVLNLSAPGIRGDDVMLALDLEGVCVSHGSACASGATTPSGVLLAMGLGQDRALSAVRVSPTPWTTMAEIERAAACYVEVAQRLRGHSNDIPVEHDANYRR